MRVKSPTVRLYRICLWGGGSRQRADESRALYTQCVYEALVLGYTIRILMASLVERCRKHVHKDGGAELGVGASHVVLPLPGKLRLFGANDESYLCMWP